MKIPLVLATSGIFMLISLRVRQRIYSVPPRSISRYSAYAKVLFLLVSLD